MWFLLGILGAAIGYLAGQDLNSTILGAVIGLGVGLVITILVVAGIGTLAWKDSKKPFSRF